MENIITRITNTSYDSVTGKDFLVFTIVGLLISLIFRVDEGLIYLFYISTILWVVVLFSVFLLPLKNLIYPILILMVSMQDIPGDRYYFDAEKFRVVGVKNKKEYNFGDLVKVRIYEVNPRKRQIDLELVV